MRLACLILGALPCFAQLPLCLPPLVWAQVQDPAAAQYTVNFTCTNLAAIPALVSANCPAPVTLPPLVPGQQVALLLSAAGVRVASPVDSGYPWEYAVANVQYGAPQPILYRWSGVPIGPTVTVTGSGCPNVLQVVQSPTQVTIICQ